MARKKGLSFTACCGSGFALAAVAVAVILIAASFRTLDATTYGLAYDSLWCTIDRTTLYNNGLFFVGPTTVFLTFPKATRDVYDTLPARTRDGLTVGLELSFQYRLQQSADSLAELYMMFGLEYESAFRREARDVLRNAASGFTAFECWRNRTALVVSMQAELDTALSRWYANVEAFQVGRRRRRRRRSPRPTDRPPAPARAARAPLTAPFPPSQLLEIGLPDRFATSIDDMEIAQQEVETAELEQGVALIRAETLLGLANRTALLTSVRALAAANATAFGGGASAALATARVDAEAEALAALASRLGLDASDELLAAAWLVAVRSSRQAAAGETLVAMAAPPLLREPANASA